MQREEVVNSDDLKNDNEESQFIDNNNKIISQITINKRDYKIITKKIIPKDFLNNEDYEIFKNFFNSNKMEFFSAFELIQSNQKNILSTNFDFVYFLHKSIIINNSAISIEFIINEVKNFIENNSLFFKTEIEKKETFEKYINKKDNCGFYPIHYAIYTGNIKLINFLYENNADFTTLSNEGYNCLHLAASVNKLEVFIFIYEKMKNKINLEDTDFEDNTVLHLVCFHGGEEILDYLKTKKIYLNPKDKKGNTPLHYAVFKGIIVFLSEETKR